VITLTDLYSDLAGTFIDQYHIDGFIPHGMSYELVISLQDHEFNDKAIDLVDKTLTIVEGAGAGQSATISAYDALNQDYTLAALGAWNVAPDSTSRYEITGSMSVESGTIRADNAATTPAAGSYNLGLATAGSLVTDSWGVVLTRQPAAGTEVIVNVLPTETRTYNADEAFNPDAAFGENLAEQVRAATDRALIQLRCALVGEYW
jgi:hypothetical protein